MVMIRYIGLSIVLISFLPGILCAFPGAPATSAQYRPVPIAGASLSPRLFLSSEALCSAYAEISKTLRQPGSSRGKVIVITPSMRFFHPPKRRPDSEFVPNGELKMFKKAAPVVHAGRPVSVSTKGVEPLNPGPALIAGKTYQITPEIAQKMRAISPAQEKDIDAVTDLFHCQARQQMFGLDGWEPLNRPQEARVFMEHILDRPMNPAAAARMWVFRDNAGKVQAYSRVLCSAYDTKLDIYLMEIVINPSYNDETVSQALWLSSLREVERQFPGYKEYKFHGMTVNAEELGTEIVYKVPEHDLFGGLDLTQPRPISVLIAYANIEKAI